MVIPYIKIPKNNKEIISLTDFKIKLYGVEYFVAKKKTILATKSAFLYTFLYVNPVSGVTTTYQQC